MYSTNLVHGLERKKCYCAVCCWMQKRIPNILYFRSVKYVEVIIMCSMATSDGIDYSCRRIVT